MQTYQEQHCSTVLENFKVHSNIIKTPVEKLQIKLVRGHSLQLCVGQDKIKAATDISTSRL